VLEGVTVSSSAGWAFGLAGALAALGLGGWFGYVLGRNAQRKGKE
jgi:hypothetical protein